MSYATKHLWNVLSRQCRSAKKFFFIESTNLKNWLSNAFLILREKHNSVGGRLGKY